MACYAPAVLCRVLLSRAVLCHDVLAVACLLCAAVGVVRPGGAGRVPQSQERHAHRQGDGGRPQAAAEGVKDLQGRAGPYWVGRGVAMARASRPARDREGPTPAGRERRKHARPRAGTAGTRRCCPREHRFALLLQHPCRGCCMKPVRAPRHGTARRGGTHAGGDRAPAALPQRALHVRERHGRHRGTEPGEASGAGAGVGGSNVGRAWGVGRATGELLPPSMAGRGGVSAVLGLPAGQWRCA